MFLAQPKTPMELLLEARCDAEFDNKLKGISNQYYKYSKMVTYERKILGKVSIRGEKVYADKTIHICVVCGGKTHMKNNIAHSQCSKCRKEIKQQRSKERNEILL